MAKNIIIQTEPEIRTKAAVIVAAIKEAGYPAQLRITRYRGNRSLKQNRLYWKWVRCIVNHLLDSTGELFTNEEVHQELVSRFLERRVVRRLGGGVREVSPSTTELTTVEFSDYLDRIEYYASDRLGLALPHPDDLYWAALMKDRRNGE